MGVLLAAGAPAEAAQAKGEPEAARIAVRGESTFRQHWTVHSPRRVLRAAVSLQGRVPRLEVRRGRRVVLAADVGRLRRPARPVNARVFSVLPRAQAKTTHVADSFTTITGKRRTHTLDATRWNLNLAGKARLELFVADDGIAIRQRGFSSTRVTYRFERNSRGYLQRLVSNYEGDYVPTRLNRVSGRYGYPALMRSGHGTWALLSEAGLRYGQPGEHLVASKRRPGILRTQAAGRTTGASPWRIAVIGTLADIVATDLPDQLAGRPAIADTEWIRPGRVAWSWWSDSHSPRWPARQRDYVDFAARTGFEYVLVDEGWDAEWVPELASYAATKGVRLLLWTDWHAIADPSTRAAVLDRWASWGVAGLKVDFLHSDSGSRLAVMEDIAAAAAERQMVVNFHGSTIPRGLQRTWPNVLTFEAVWGSEHEKGGVPDDPALNVTLAFTRNVIGSMDYTPVTFSANNRLSTSAAQLAQSVIFESGLQHYADSPESYATRPQALELLRQVPAVWDDVRLLGGAPRRSVTLARRSGERWFVGSLSAIPARTERVALTFLDERRAYTARIYADQAGDEIAISEYDVTADTVLELPVAANGGFVVTLTPS